jgi:hypothetical protein
MNEPKTWTREITQRTELALRVPNEVNVLAKLFSSLALMSEDIDGWHFYSDHKRATILLLTGDTINLLRCLQADGFDYDTHPVVVMAEPHRTVSAVRLSTELRSSGVVILDAYTCRSSRNGTSLVLKTTNGPRTVEVLEAMNFPQPEPPVLRDLPADIVENVATVHATEEAA